MSKRELIEPTPGDKRYVRRDDKGHFTEAADVGKSSAPTSDAIPSTTPARARATRAIAKARRHDLAGHEKLSGGSWIRRDR